MTGNLNTINIMSWNLGGAKFLKEPEEKRNDFRKELNKTLNEFVKTRNPDFILLQEIVQFEKGGKCKSLIKVPQGYHYDSSISISTNDQSHPTKWQKYRECGNWRPDAFLAQGCGILWRKDIPHASLWDFEPGTGENLEKEIVRIDTGLYTGDRDTEPRSVVITHFILENGGKPVDFFLVNLHLTTLKGEREGFPSRDDDGCKRRLEQIDIILNGIVSRYNQWRKRKLEALGEKSRAPAVWVLGGDFNCVPESPEIRKIERMNFINLNPNMGKGTKGTGFPAVEPAITVDYIFAGPAYFALDPYEVKEKIKSNPLPLYTVKLSDHFPVFAELPLCFPK